MDRFTFLRNLWHVDFVALLLVTGLVGFGIAAIMGSTINDPSDSTWIRQTVWVGLGFVLLIGVMLVDYRWFIRWAPVVYGLALLALVLCFVPPFAHEAKGATSWIRIPGIPIPFQPAEFAKIATVLMLTWWMGRRQCRWNGFLDMAVPLAIGIVPSLLILRQPDLGTAIVFGPITVLMMFVSGMPLANVVLLLSPMLCLLGVVHDPIFLLLWVGLMSGVVLLTLWERTPWTVWVPFVTIACLAYVTVFAFGEKIWEEMPHHQKERLISYMDPEFDLKGANYNIYQAKIALGAGGFWGKGLGEGTQSTLGFIPEFEHDFIFTALGEQLGFIGGATLLGLFLFLIIRGLDTAIESKTLQGALIATGVIAMFFSHIFVNVGMVTGLLPVTGLPLTFISYGGTFMLANLIGVGLLLNVRYRASVSPAVESLGPNRQTMNIPKTYSEDFSEF